MAPLSNTSLQRFQPPRDASTPDLLRVRSSNSTSPEQLSPATIRRQCEEIYRVVANYGNQTSPQPEGVESGYNTMSKPREPEPRSRMSSTSSIGNRSPPMYRGSSLPPMQHPLQVDLSNHDVKSISSKGSSIENKDSEIDRLQRELYDAQVCNYRLNNQMGKLVDKDWRREEVQLRVEVDLERSIRSRPASRCRNARVCVLCVMRVAASLEFAQRFVLAPLDVVIAPNIVIIFVAVGWQDSPLHFS
uniref:Similar to n=1 Tax=Panagrellus redivivus TaxID=6233 RepID=A0A7E4VUC7_PANRE